MSKQSLDLPTLQKHSIYEVVAGSHSYGLNIETSDKDLKGIVIVPRQELFTLSEEWETTSYSDPDIEYHSLKKFMKLASNQNPTILEMIFTEPEFVVKSTPLAEKLRENRHLFLSKNCFYTYGGYAQQQLMRLKNGLDKATQLDHNEHLRYTVENIIRGFYSRYENYDNNIQVVDVYYDKEGKQQLDLKVNFNSTPITQFSGMVSEIQNAYKGYTKLTNRNKKTEGKLGKHAMHLVRLFQAGVDVLETGDLKVKRNKDRDFLLSIRNGEHDWDEVFAMADNLGKKLRKAYDESNLPKKVDYDKLNKLYNDIMLEYFEGGVK